MTEKCLKALQKIANTANNANTANTATEHVVKRGENPSIIAKKYNCPVDTVMQANGLTPESAKRLAVGHKLIIPAKTTPPEPKLYRKPVKQPTEAEHRAFESRLKNTSENKIPALVDEIADKTKSGK